MTAYSASMDVDANFRPIYSPLPFMVRKNIVFDGNTVNGIGDHDGTADPTTLFTVTGDILCFVIGVCKTTLVGAATIEVGVANATAAILAQVADATTLAVNEVWNDSTPSLAESFTTRYHGIGGGLDIIMTLGSANVTAGEIDFYCFYRPLSTDGLVVAG